MDMPNYMPEKFKCYNFIDLLEKSKSILFQNSDKFKQSIDELNKTIYSVDEKTNTRKKIARDLENQLINS